MIKVAPANLEIIRPFVYEDLIRVGNKADGGYVIPERVLDTPKYCISFGIGYNHTFEAEIQKRIPNIKIIGFDHSVGILYFFSKSINAGIKLCLNRGTTRDFKLRTLRFANFVKFWVKNSQNKHNKTKITSENIYKILDEFKDEDILLKIDIEGSEWDTLPLVVNDITNVNCLIMEFHHLSTNYSKFKKLLNELQENFNVAHTHINNFSSIDYSVIPEFIEITFANKKYIHSAEKINYLPNAELDCKTMPRREDFEVVF
jgi:hypothetical protein